MRILGLRGANGCEGEGDKTDSKRIEGEGRFNEVGDGSVGEPMGQSFGGVSNAIIQLDGEG